jgi:hypothetical protein
MEIKTGAAGKGGIPGLVKLFASFTAAFKANATYKDELRRVIRNSFGELAAAFNTLIQRAEDALRDTGNGNRVVFMIDGTDKLRGEDTRLFFVHDAEQLLAIETLVVYTAPLSLKYEGNLAGNDERTRRLLYNLALLEYNDGTWRRSHPVVRTLEGYRRLTQKAVVEFGP